MAGWAFADAVLHRLAPLWVGARGLEFTWDYILQGLEANANLVFFSLFMLSLTEAILILCACVCVFYMQFIVSLQVYISYLASFLGASGL